MPDRPDPQTDPDGHLEWVLTEVIDDMTSDVKRFDGMPLVGAVVGEMTGNLAAAICALAEVNRALLHRVRELEDELR